MITKEQAKKELRRRILDRSFYEFVLFFWPVIEPRKFINGAHIKIVCDHLQAVYEGKILNLIINIPPGYSKSLICNVFFPAWVWFKQPEKRFLCAAGVDTLATRDSVKCRRLIQSSLYQWLKPLKLMGDQDTKTRYDNDHLGFRYALSVGSSSTGERGDIRIIDDPHKASEIHSKTIREGVITWHDEEFSTRKNDPDKSSTILIMQRLHFGDLSGHLLAKGGWEHLCLPGVHDGVKRTTSIGWQETRNKGDFLWPEVYNKQNIEQLRKDLGSYGFAGQIMQTPVAEEGGIIKKHWFKYERVLPVFTRRILSLDCSFKNTEDSDFVAIQYWGQVGSKKYLIKRFRARLDLPSTIDLCLEWAKQPYDRFLIEEKANGPGVIQMVKRSLPRVIPINPKDSKEARLHMCSNDFEAGDIYFNFYEDTENLRHELTGFPATDNDDEMDACTQALNDMRIGEKKNDVYNPNIIPEVSDLRTRQIAEKRKRNNESYFG